MTDTRNRFRALVGRWLLLGIASFSALILGELLVRAVGKAPDVKAIALSSADCVYQRSPNPLLSFELKPNYRCDAPDLNQQFERTNAFGLRDRERSLDKPPGARRVILLGDSVVEGHGIRETETISRQLEELLAQENTEVLNFGVSGYCTRAEVELLETRGLAFRPDVVVLVFVENDFQNFNREAFVLNSPERPRLVKGLFLHSHLFRLAAIRLDLWRFGSDADPADRSRRAVGENNVLAGLRRFSELSREHGFAPLIAVWPGFSDDTIVDLHYLPGDDGRLVIEVLGDIVRIPTVRLSRDFSSDRAQQPGDVNPRLTYTVDDGMHPSPAGSRLAARALQKYLAQLRTGELASAESANDDAAREREAKAIAEALALGRERPTKSRVYNNVGVGLLDSDQPEKALEYFRLALDEDATYADAHNNWGLALQKLDRLNEAVEHYLSAVHLNPGLAEAHNNLGTALRALERREEAAAHFEEALRIKPNHAESHFNWGTLLQDQGRLEEAIVHYQAALRLRPTYGEVHNNWGLALKDQGQAEEALAHFTEALRRKPKSAPAHYNSGLALADLGRFDEAILHYQAALRMKPDYAEAHNNWGFALASQNRLAEAAEHFREALRLKPDFPLARDNLRQAESLLGSEKP